MGDVRFSTELSFLNLANKTMAEREADSSFQTPLEHLRKQATSLSWETNVDQE